MATSVWGCAAHEPGGDWLDRFVEEAQICSQLQHPNIMPVYDIGLTEGGYVLYTMKLVKGRSYQAVLDQPRETRQQLAGRAGVLREALDIFRRIVAAVAYAHSKGVVHRDIKPENVMVGRFDEVLVMDWGLAKILGRTAQPSPIDDLVMSDRFEDDREHTIEGTVKGTPAYMSPEQAMGDISKLDARTDIYALGALLYEMLTLKPPYEGSSPLKVLADVARGELVAPAARAPQRYIPRELEAVVLKAMAKKPTWRYQSIAALKADIDAYLSGRTLEAANYTPWQLLRKWAARNTPVVVGVATGLVMLIGGIIFTMTLMHDRDLAEARERQQNEIDRLNERQEEQRLNEEPTRAHLRRRQPLHEELGDDVERGNDQRARRHERHPHEGGLIDTQREGLRHAGSLARAPVAGKRLCQRKRHTVPVRRARSAGGSRPAAMRRRLP